MQVAADRRPGRHDVVVALSRTVPRSTRTSCSASPSRRASTEGRSPGGSSTEPFSEALASFAGRPLRLVRVNEPGAGSDRGVGASVSVVSSGTLDRLAREAGEETIDGRRFRMLFGIEGVERSRGGRLGWTSRRLRRCRRQPAGARRPLRRDDARPRHGSSRPRHAPHPQGVPLRGRERGAASDRRLGRCRAAGAGPGRRSRGAAVTIDPATSLGPVALTVADLDAQVAFYEDAIGLREIRRDGDTVELGAPGGDTPLVALVGRPDAPPRPPRTTGLFHLALLVPSRAELARSLHRVTAAGHRFTGASDHLVSEALYLDDPEGNGIEIYRDRPREEWSVRRTASWRWRRCRSTSTASSPAPRPGDAGAGMADRHPDRPRPPPGRGHPCGRGVLRRCARLRADGARLSRCALRLGGRLPPPPRAQHVGRPGRSGTSARSSRAALLHRSCFPTMRRSRARASLPPRARSRGRGRRRRPSRIRQVTVPC